MCAAVDTEYPRHQPHELLPPNSFVPVIIINTTDSTTRPSITAPFPLVPSTTYRVSTLSLSHAHGGRAGYFYIRFGPHGSWKFSRPGLKHKSNRLTIFWRFCPICSHQSVDPSSSIPFSCLSLFFVVAVMCSWLRQEYIFHRETWFHRFRVSTQR